VAKEKTRKTAMAVRLGKVLMEKRTRLQREGNSAWVDYLC